MSRKNGFHSLWKIEDIIILSLSLLFFKQQRLSEKEPLTCLWYCTTNPDFPHDTNFVFPPWICKSNWNSTASIVTRTHGETTRRCTYFHAINASCAVPLCVVWLKWMSQNTLISQGGKNVLSLFVNWLVGFALGGGGGGGLNPGIHPQKRWKTVWSITDEQWMEEKRNAATGSLTVNVSFHSPHSVGVTGQLWHCHLWHLHTESTPCTPCEASSQKIYQGPWLVQWNISVYGLKHIILAGQLSTQTGQELD